MTKITKNDIKENFYYFKSILLFTILLAIVYGYLTFILCDKHANNDSFKWIFSILVFFVCLIFGALCEYFYLRHQVKHKEKSNL